jgi:hypothetical protein
MIEAIIGWTVAGTWSSRSVRISMIFALPARLGAIALATSAWT